MLAATQVLRNRTASHSLLSRPDWARVFVSVPNLTTETRSSQASVSRAVVPTGSLSSSIPSVFLRIYTSAGLKARREQGLETCCQQMTHEKQVRMISPCLTKSHEHRTNKKRDRLWSEAWIQNGVRRVTVKLCIGSNGPPSLQT